ncbi:hypothetical protein EU538_03705 [Candidatus Thorarchaeota archaeon]|nr:MAG: hypothetical protein EU538_03705 [Candidatus Thorarchaeota archaeon]
MNRLQGIQFEVQPSDDEEHSFFLINLPEDLPGFWVRIGFDVHDVQSFVTLKVDVGQKAATSLLGREISILTQPYHG